MNTATSKVTETTAAVILAAETFGDALVKRGMRAALAAASTTACPRCQGRGVALFGCTYGDCHRCGGSGSLVAKKADRDAIAKVRAAIDVERMRVMWRAYKMAISMLRGGMSGGANEHEIEMMIANYERKVAALTKSGKEAAVLAA